MNNKNMDPPNWTLAQLMVTAAAREIADKEVIFVGMRLPLLGFLLAKSTHAPDAIGVYELGIVRDAVAPEPILTMGDLPNLNRAQWLADTADAMGLLQQGGVDVSFIGGAQVDRYGNLNTSYIGGAEAVETRLPPTVEPHQLGVDRLVEGGASELEGLLHAVTHRPPPVPSEAEPRWGRRGCSWYRTCPEVQCACDRDPR